MAQDANARAAVRDGIEAGSREDRILEIIGIGILAVATLLTAWSGFQATKWSGVQATSYTKAGAQRIAANSFFTLGVLEAVDIQSDFKFWLFAKHDGNDELASLYSDSLEEAIPEAWESWQANYPVENGGPITSPLDTDKYRLSTVDQVTSRTEAAEDLFRTGVEANGNADNYVLATVFFAVSLFFSGVSTSLHNRRVRHSLLVISGSTLLFASIWLATMPIEV